MKKFLLILTLLTLTMAACSRQTQAPAEKVPEVGLPADESPVEGDLPTATVTKSPTLTPSPTETTSPTETLSPTNSPTPRPSSTPTADPEPDVRATVAAGSEPLNLFDLDSPDGRWRAEGRRYECTPIEGGEYAGGDIAYEAIVLTDRKAGTEKTIDSQLQYCGGMGAFGLGGLYWSPNSRYFYYTDAREGVPDGGCGFWGRPILRYDIVDSGTTRLGAGPVAPDGSKLATWQGRDLVVWDLDGAAPGAEIGRAPAAVEAAEAYLGKAVWSPDSRSLVYLQVESYCPLSGKSYLVYFDLADQEPEIQLESEAPTFGSVVWVDPAELRLADESGATWRFDLETKQLAPNP